MSHNTRDKCDAEDERASAANKIKRRFTFEELLAGMTPEREHPSWDDVPRGSEFPNEETD